MKRRLDQALVERGLVSSRTRARDLIEAGRVTVDGAPAGKPSLEVEEQTRIQLVADEADRFVSRAGLKLEGALRETGVVAANRAALDVGQSTGGFTDCLLQSGARLVVGVDVGHGQLHAKLAADPRVRAFEGVNARDAGPKAAFLEPFGASGPEIVVVDVSFISLTLILPALSRLVGPGVPLIALVKPQFEVGPSGLGKGGVVRDPLLYPEVERKISRAAEECGWQRISYFESALEGKDGNKEFFLHAIKR